MEACILIIFFILVETDKFQGPGSIRHYGGKCIHVLGAAYLRPKNGENIVLYQGCGEEQQEFQLWPNGSLMLTKHGMCVKPISNEADVYRTKVCIHERVISVVDLQYHNKINIFLASDRTWLDFKPSAYRLFNKTNIS